MKKTYMTPEMEVMNIETVEMMATSTMSLNDDVENTDTEQQAGDRRGTWGNLWN